VEIDAEKSLLKNGSKKGMLGDKKKEAAQRVRFRDRSSQLQLSKTKQNVISKGLRDVKDKWSPRTDLMSLPSSISIQKLQISLFTRIKVSGLYAST